MSLRAHRLSLRPPRAHRERKRIALLLDYMSMFGGGYEAQVREAFHARCREQDVDLLLVYGRAVDAPEQASAAHNGIFELLDGGAVDGLIVVSTLLSAYSFDGVRRFVERQRGLPLCSFGVALPGVPSVALDNHSGIAQAVEHLIEHHGARRIAYVGGPPANPEAEARLKGYVNVIERHGIAFDPRLVASGQFTKADAFEAMRTLLARGARPDAVVAANDHMAIGAIEALRKHGHRVPRHVSVTGFDDLSLARLANPPLTTVAQPFARMAALGLDLVLDQIAGRPVPDLSSVSGEFVVRQSCGCTYEQTRASLRTPERAACDAGELLAARSVAIRENLSRVLGVGRADGARDAARMVAALTAEFCGDREAFVGLVEDLLEHIGDDNERYRGLQSAVSYLREELGSATTPGLDELWHSALALIAITNTTVQTEHRLAIDAEYFRLLSVGEQLSAAFDLVSLKHALGRVLPATGVETALLSRYTDSGLTELEAFACLVDGKPVEPQVPRFPAAELLPPGSLPRGRQSTLVVMPLVFEAQPLGVAAFEYAGRSGYQVVRDQIAAALKSVGLHEEVVEKTTQHERSLQERLATSKRMQSLSVLAGGVAHDLNNALGPLVALPEIILRELSGLDVGTAVVRDVRADLESIKTASLRAAQTIKDLLTLGRQGRAPKEPVDLNRIVASSLSPETLRFFAASHPAVGVGLELSPEPLVLQGSEAHVARAVTNLVRNAIEAIQGRGRVAVRTSAAVLTEPSAGYEPVEPGEYAVLTVADDGCGIPQHELTRIFEPFFSKKPVDDDRGTGLGLAIVHGVVKEHDGFVDVTSRVGAGTTFTLYFPRSRELPRSRDSAISAGGGRGRLLLVDDDPIQLRTGRRILRHFGYHVDTLHSGQAAYDVFAKASLGGLSPYELVVLDMALNETEDGLEIFDRIRSLFPEQKAIVASGHAPSERLELAVARGLPWLSKPYTADALAHAVEAALAERPSARLKVALAVF